MLAVSEAAKKGKGGKASVVCPAGYTMTGCNAFAESGRSAGAKIFGESWEESCTRTDTRELVRGGAGKKGDYCPDSCTTTSCNTFTETSNRRASILTNQTPGKGLFPGSAITAFCIWAQVCGFTRVVDQTQRLFCIQPSPHDGLI